MTTITMRRSVSGEPIPAPGFAGAMGATRPTHSNDIEVSIEIDSTDPEVVDRVTLSATAAFNVVESFADVEPGAIEFVDEGIPIPDPDPTGEYPDGWHPASQSETDHAVHEETEVDGKSAEELGLQDHAAYYITTTEGERTLAIYARQYFEDRNNSWYLSRIKSFRFAAPAVKGGSL